MAIIIGREKKSQKRMELKDVQNGLKAVRIAAAEKKEELKVAAEEAERKKAEQKEAKKRGRKAAVKEQPNEGKE
jgi:hypothetical protein